MFELIIFKPFNLFIRHSYRINAPRTNQSFTHLNITQRRQVRNIMTNSSDIETCKATAAKLAVDENIKNDCVVGIGSGSTMRYVVERIVRVSAELGVSVKCIPTSFQSKELIYKYNLPITELDCHPVIDLTIDGADEVDENLVAIKGGGACLAQEKIVAFAAKKFVVVADYRKNSKYLGQSWTRGIPIEVLPMACNAVRHYIHNEFNSELADVEVRIGREKAGPVISDNGNFILDWKFKPDTLKNLQAINWKDLSDRVKLIPGVIETGIFANMIHEVYFGELDGSINKKLSQQI